MNETPLEKAREKEACVKCVKVGNAYYCEESGKLLHPLCIENDSCVRNCEHKVTAKGRRMTDYELILTSAMRYALGRRTYIVGVTVGYIISELPNLSQSCKSVMIRDIEEQESFGYGDECDKRDWMRLLDKLRSDE